MRHGLLLAALLYAAGATGTALATPSPPDNPSANITFSPPASCYGSPTSATCENAVVSALNSAHAALGLGPYTVPADFDSLPPAEQMFILSNLDREAFGLPTIVGLSSDLNSAAALGVAEDSDPDPEPELPADLPLEGWDSNWAGGFVNAPDAYYEWMYDDGPGSPNEDCGAGGGGGCWGHRDDVLAFSNAGALVMGAASGTDGGGMAGYAMTIVATQDASTSWTTLTYTWAQAQADIGGGSSSGGSGGGSSGGSGSGGSSGGGGSGGGSSGGGSSGGGSSGGGSGSGSSGAGGSSGVGTDAAGGGSSSGSGAGGAAGSSAGGGGSAGSAAGSTPTPAAGASATPAATVITAAPTPLITRLRVARGGHAVRVVLGGSNVAGAFQCALVRRGTRHKPRYAPCGAVRVYRHLAAGRYTFYARASKPVAGSKRTSVRRSFSIR